MTATTTMTATGTRTGIVTTAQTVGNKAETTDDVDDSHHKCDDYRSHGDDNDHKKVRKQDEH